MKDLTIRVLSVYFLVIISLSNVRGTIDVNVNDLEYLAARLNPFECRRLIAALHYTTYELPKSLNMAENKVDEEIPCIRLLIHWNSFPEEGKGKTHEAIVHRLRQINRKDLADWLGKSAFKQLGKDLNRAMVQPLVDRGEESTEISFPLTIVPIETPDDEDSWSQIDTVLIAILLGLLGTLLTLICASILFRIRLYFRQSRYRKLKEKEAQSRTEIIEKRKKRRPKYSAESTGESTNNMRTGNETDTDFG